MNGADLIAYDFHFDPIFWISGGTVNSTWTWTVENQGDQPIVTTTVGVYISADSTIRGSDTLLFNGGSTGALDPGATVSFSLPFFTTSANIAPGSYFVGVLADPSNFRVEADETNNASNVIQVTVSAAPLGADFITTAPVFSSRVWQEGEIVTADWRLINQGDATSGPVSSTVYLSIDPTVDTSDLAIGIDITSGDMSPGENNPEDFDTPFVVPNLAPGIYYAAALGDSGNVTAEIDEANNWSPVVMVQIAATPTNGDDVIDMSLSAENENAAGLDGNDTIITGSGTDILNGGPGDDILIGGGGSDLLQGGTGTNTASYATATAGLTADLVVPGNNAGDAAGDIYSGIQNLTGSDFDDVLWGTFGANTLEGLGGNDTLFGRDGDDVLDGGDGDDMLIGGGGIDAFTGGAGTDRVQYQDVAAGLRANLINSAGNTGAAAGETYNSIENLLGSQGDDTLFGDNNVNDLNGFTGNDTLFGLDGDDILRGGDGDDFLVGNDGVDTFIGGAGTDRVQYQDVAAGLRASLLNQAANTGAAAGETYNSIENLLGSQGDDTLFGDNNVNDLNGFTGNDILFGLAGDDILRGGDGDDFLVGNDGVDTFIGGAGTDRVQYQDVAAGLRASLLNQASNTGAATGETYNSIENLLGSQGDDVLIGDNGVNDLNGFTGNDTLFGLDGDDILRGGDGDDMLIGNDGVDTFIGGAGTDRVQYQDVATGLRASLLNQASNTGAAAGETYNSIENLLGSQGDDILIGDNGINDLNGFTGNDILQGLGGNDILRGGDGDDILGGGLGADTLIGGAGMDRAGYAASAAGIVADLQNAAANTGEAAGDVYNSIEDLQGSALNDDLRGDGGANRLFGGAGNDILTGRGGNDSLFGQAGDDTFVFADGFGAVLVFDFDAFSNGEKVDLSAVTNITDFADLAANHLSQNGAHAVITDGGGTITLLNVQTANLDANDFLF